MFYLFALFGFAREAR